jgi:hypothetical protein
MTWFAFTANQSDRVNSQDGIAIGYVQLVLDNKILNLARNLQMWPYRYSVAQCAIDVTTAICYVYVCSMMHQLTYNEIVRWIKTTLSYLVVSSILYVPISLFVTFIYREFYKPVDIFIARLHLIYQPYVAMYIIITINKTQNFQVFSQYNRQNMKF